MVRGETQCRAFVERRSVLSALCVRILEERSANKRTKALKELLLRGVQARGKRILKLIAFVKRKVGSALLDVIIQNW